MKVLTKWWWLLLVVLVAGLVRFYQLEEVPAGLYYDEVDLAYQARSLLETGRDYQAPSVLSTPGQCMILRPDTLYLSLPAAAIFSPGVLQARVTTALAGIAVVVLASLLTLKWSKDKRAAFLVGAVMALNPWLIQFSRIAFEAMFALMMYLGFGTYLF